MNRFTCEEVFRRLDDYLDRELGAQERRLVEEHLADCATCFKEFSYERGVLDGVKGKLRRLTLPPDLLARIQRRVGEGSEREADPE